MKTLYICEKPSQAKDIAAVLNVCNRKDGYYEDNQTVVTYCIGHLLEMENPDGYDLKYKKWSFETLPILPDVWKMKVTAKVKKQFQVIKRLLGQTQHVIISTDADREGEIIAREILDLCQYQGSIERLWLSALDVQSIRKALDNILPDHKTKPLYYAGLGRGRADWLIGMNLTRAYTLLSKQSGGDQVVSVGRVQTPTLNLVVKRDIEIESFTPVPFFDVIIDCDATGSLYKAKWVPEKSPGVTVDSEGRCLNQTTAQEVTEQVKQRSGKIIHFEKIIKNEKPPLPYDLSSLQIEASKRFALDANAVLKAAQGLYETHKATTYPRTDCRYLPVSQFEEADNILSAVKLSDPDWTRRSAIDKADLSLQSRCWNDKKITAHHAIIPTAATIDMSRLSDEELKIYELIRQHFVMQFFPAYRYEAITCHTQVAEHTFSSRGHKDLNAGWKVMSGNKELNDQDDQQALPESLNKDMSIRVVNSLDQNKLTKPLAHFTSGTLIAAMKNAGRLIENPELRKVLKETSGIGTEATRASIIDTLIDRTYLKKSGKFLVSTDFGRTLISLVPEVLKDPGTTALWEQVLDDIANNKTTLDAFMVKQKTFIEQMIEYLQQQHIEVNYNQPQYPCSVCGKPLQKISTKKNTFWGCTGYPDCHETLPDNNAKPGQKSEPKKSTMKQLVVGQKCPQCSTGILQLKTIQSGKNVGKEFVGCTNYPTCKLFSWGKLLVPS
jgi:DNA topoisomerase III